MEPQLARHPATLPAIPDTGKQGPNYFCTLQQSRKIFIIFVDVLKGKWSCQHLCWACQLIPLTLNTSFGPGPLFFSLNQELSEQEAEPCKFMLMRRLRHAALMPRLRSPDDASGLPWTESTLWRRKVTPCDSWVTLASGSPRPLQNGSLLVLLRLHSHLTDS